MSGIVIIVAIVSLVLGLTLSWVFLEKRLSQQRRNHLEQMRQAIEKLEQEHEQRMQQAIEPVQQQYEVQLQAARQRIAELENVSQTASIDAAPDSQAEIQQLRQHLAELERMQASQIEEVKQSLQLQYETQLAEISQRNPELATEQQAQTFPDDVRVQYETQINQLHQRIAELESIQVERLQDMTQTLHSQYVDQLETLQQRNNVLEQEQQVRFEAATLAVREQYQNLLQEVSEFPAAATATPSGAEVEVIEPDTQLLTPAETQPVLGSLSEQVQTWGKSGQVKYILPLTKYAAVRDVPVRTAVAVALGQIMTLNAAASRNEQAIATLGKLSQDPKPEVRLAAIEALGAARSPQSLPYLQRALKDPLAQVVKKASLGLKKLNLTTAKRSKVAIATQSPQNRKR